MAEPGKAEDEAPAELVSAESMLEMILTKEDENEAQQKVEEAKLDAAVIKRDAVTAEAGSDLREKEIAKAREEAERVTAEITERAEQVRKKGMEHIEDDVKIVIDAVLPR